VVGSVFGVIALIVLGVMYKNRRKGGDADGAAAAAGAAAGSVNFTGVMVDGEAERQARLQQQIEQVSFCA
jgi:hypothetical protein